MRVGHNLFQKQIKCIIDVCNLPCIWVSLLALRHACIRTHTRTHTHTHTLKSRGRTVVSVKHWIWRWLFLINDLCAPPQSDRWALMLSTAALILFSSAVLSRTGRLAEWNKLIPPPVPFPLPSYPSLWSSLLNLTNFIHPLANNLALRQLVSGFLAFLQISIFSELMNITADVCCNKPLASNIHYWNIFMT